MNEITIEKQIICRHYEGISKKNGREYSFNKLFIVVDDIEVGLKITDSIGEKLFAREIEKI